MQNETATTSTGQTPASLDELRLRLSGGLFEPGEDGYEDACTLFNSMIEIRPALVARCAAPDDVISCLAYARENDLEVAVRAGGHSVAGLCLREGGLVLDVRPMNSVEVDPERRIGKVGGGATWVQFDEVAQRHGLATTGGRVSTTGVAGFTLGGGSGWLERKHGLACDNLIAAEMVTADGRIVRTSAKENPSLLWALRGGGGNFGVVTSLEFELHPVGPEVFGGLAIYAMKDAPTVVRAWRDLMEDAPQEVSTAILYIRAPAEEPYPEHLHGELIAIFCGMHCGSVADGEAAIRPAIDSAEPAVDLFGPIPYTELQCLLDDPPGNRNYWAVEHLPEFPDATIDLIHERALEMPGAAPQVLIGAWGGAVTTRGADSAVAGREAKWLVHPLMLWDDPADDEAVIGWTRRFRAELAPETTGAIYANFASAEESATENSEIFEGGGYARLARVKAEWDPDDVFRGSGHIVPSSA